MSELDKKIYNAIKRLDWYFGQHKYIICGSVGLYMQGIDLGREPHDLDLIIPGKKRFGLFRLFNIVKKRSGFILDFPLRPLEDNEEVKVIDFNGLTVKVQTKEDILKCKEIIVEKHLYYDNGMEKQKQDIEKIKNIIYE